MTLICARTALDLCSLISAFVGSSQDEPFLESALALSDITLRLTFSERTDRQLAYVAESSVTSFTYSVAAGISSPPVAIGPVGFTLGCHLGWQAISLGRSIGGCSDCDEEEIADVAGSFVEPTILVGILSSDSLGNYILGLHGSYRAFLGTSGIRYVATLGFAAGL